MERVFGFCFHGIMFETNLSNQSANSMHKILFFSLAIILSQNIHSQSAALSISLYDSTLFVAELNGKMFDKPSSVMNFFELPQGEQKLRVYKLMRKGNSEIRKSVFEGQITLPNDVLTTAYIDATHQFRVSATEPIKRRKLNRGERELDIVTKEAINRQQFEAVVEHLIGISNESERLRAAENVILIHTITSRHIAELMLLFENENRRIALANYAYRYVTDPHNFGEVHHSLRHPSSHRRLIRRIR